MSAYRRNNNNHLQRGLAVLDLHKLDLMVHSRGILEMMTLDLLMHNRGILEMMVLDLLMHMVFGLKECVKVILAVLELMVLNV